MSEFWPWFNYLLISCNIGISNPPPLKYSDVFYGWPLRMPYAESSSARHETSCRTSILFSSQLNINSEYLFFGQKGVQTHSESVSWLMSWTDHIKGHLISKCIFGVFAFFQKTNENKSTSSKVEFVCLFFGRNVGLKKSFRICLTFREYQNWWMNHFSPGCKYNCYFRKCHAIYVSALFYIIQ